MWVKGAALSDIARSAGMLEGAVQAYLATRSSLPVGLTFHFKPDLKPMIDQVLPDGNVTLSSPALIYGPDKIP